MSTTRRPRLSIALPVVILVLLGALLAYVYMTDTNAISAANRRESILSAELAGANSTIASLRGKLAASNNTIAAADGQITTLQGQIAKDNGKISADNATISGLQSQIRSDTNQISSLQSGLSMDSAKITGYLSQISDDQSELQSYRQSVTDLQGEVDSDQTQVISLQSQVAMLSAASLVGSFASTVNCPLVGNCSYPIIGPYANFGADTANAASVTFTFYSSSNSTGQVLCTTTVALGSVQGRSLNALPAATCSSSSGTAAMSFSWSFSHS